MNMNNNMNPRTNSNSAVTAGNRRNELSNNAFDTAAMANNNTVAFSNNNAATVPVSYNNNNNTNNNNGNSNGGYYDDYVNASYSGSNTQQPFANTDTGKLYNGAVQHHSSIQSLPMNNNGNPFQQQLPPVPVVAAPQYASMNSMSRYQPPPQQQQQQQPPFNSYKSSSPVSHQMAHHQQQMVPSHIPANPYAVTLPPAPVQQQQQQQQQPPEEDVFGIFGSVVGKDIVLTPSKDDKQHLVSAVDEDETSVLSMTSTHYPAVAIPPMTQVQLQQDRQLQFLAQQQSDAMSVSTVATHSSRPSPLDNPEFAPAPKKTRAIENAQVLARQIGSNGEVLASSPLPEFDKIQHSGYILGRISFRTILMKRWKQIFWIMYGSHTIYFFRSYQDFLDWVSNPYLTLVQRDFLVKLKIDFFGDLLKSSVRGYQVTRPTHKSYRHKLMSQFKLERWMDYGPTIAAAFASEEDGETQSLRCVMLEIMKRGHQPEVHSQDANSIISGGGGNNNDGGRSVSSSRSARYPHNVGHNSTPGLQNHTHSLSDARSVQTDPQHPYQYNQTTGAMDIYGSGKNIPGRQDGDIGFRTRRSFLKKKH